MNTEKPPFKKILVIADTQCKPGVNHDHLEHIGKYIMDLRPDVIFHIGDHYDLPSLSPYDKGTAKIDGKRLRHDIDVAYDGLALITKPLREYQAQVKRNKNMSRRAYNPELIFCLGNHEDRLDRYVNNNPEMQGFLEMADLGIEKLGWTVSPFLVPVERQGILFSHYFANPMTGKPIGGQALAMLKTIGKSFVMGHRQELTYANRTLCDGTQQIAVVNGAFYSHEESYKGPQGNKHWRGVVVLNEAVNGYADIMTISLDYLRRRYGGDKPLEPPIVE